MKYKQNMDQINPNDVTNGQLEQIEDHNTGINAQCNAWARLKSYYPALVVKNSKGHYYAANYTVSQLKTLCQQNSNKNYAANVWITYTNNGTATNTSAQKAAITGPTVTTIESLINNTFMDCKQIVLTGAPGTGKTYAALEYVKEAVKTNNIVDGNRYKFVQFHSSYDYTDFVEGLRPVVVDNGGKKENAFVRMDGTFKEFCRRAFMDYLEYRNNSVFCIGSTYATPEKKYEELDKIMNGKEGNEQPEIERMEKDRKPNNPKGTSTGSTVVSTTNRDKEYFKKRRYYFIIDEINRADLSKVFGELMFGLEEGYRGIANRFETQYKNLPTYEIPETYNGQLNTDKIAVPMEFDCFRDGFFIPENVYIIGTMNDIDRSVEAFDFALRRRFRWIEIKANYHMKESLHSMLDSKNITGFYLKNNDNNVKDIDELAIHITKMNEQLTSVIEKKFCLNKSYHIGAAYFKDYDGKNMDEIWEQKIKPIIREYVRGRSQNDIYGLVERCHEALLTGKVQGDKDKTENNGDGETDGE